jgi:DNA repair exonuclease SbcCD ATPase subunit
VGSTYSKQDRLDRDAQVRTLSECDEDLSLIANDVVELHRELAQLRTDGTELAQLLSERDALVHQQKQALSKLESERGRLGEQARAASEALGAAETRRAAHDQRVASLEQELNTLRAGIAERERRLAEVEAQSSQLQTKLAERTVTEAGTAQEPIVGHVRLTAGAQGYNVSVSDDRCPSPGERVEIEGERFVVLRTGPAPFPRDDRRCAFLIPELS